MENHNSENPNSEKNNEIREKRPKAAAQVGVISAEKEKIYILLAMIAFALIILTVTLAITFCGKDGTGDGNGDGKDPVVDDDNGDDDNNANKHNYQMTLELVDGKFNVIGHCTDEGCTAPDIIERDVQGVTVSSEVAATCSADGKKIYTYTKDGKNLTFEETLAKTGHMINGVSVDSLKDKDGALTYDGKNVHVLGTRNCGTIVPSDVGSFLCSSCNKLIGAIVYIPHIKGTEWVVEEDAICGKDGKECIYCKLCNEEVMEERTIPALTHSYVDTLEYRKADNTIWLVSDCKNEGCPDKSETDVTALATQSGYEPATCGSKEKTTYSYVKDGITLTCVKYGETDGDHEYRTDLMKPDGTYDYAEGITVPLGASSIVCGGTSYSFFLECIHCGSPKLVGNAIETIKVNVPSHKYVIDQIETYPTFNTIGKIYIKCKHSDWCREIISIQLDKVTIGTNAISTPDGKLLYTFTAPCGTTLSFTMDIPASDDNN